MGDKELSSPGLFLRIYLHVLVMLTGGIVLALEILGTRVIGTEYGSSLYVWAALLSVTLVCLAFGYAIGGRLADRLPYCGALFVLVILAGLSVLLIRPFTPVIEPLSRTLGLAWGAIASALIIFFLPLTLLAMASPYVIRLLAARVERIGSVSGSIYALSTIGSVAGVLAVSLWMIPAMGTRTSLWACSAGLVLLGLVGLAMSIHGGRGAIVTAATMLLAALSLAVGFASTEPPVPGQLYHCESPFGDLRVIQAAPQGSPHRMLMVNGIMQTGMPLDIDLVAAGSILQSDRYFLELLPYYHRDLADGRRGILIGLAGGMFPRVMEFYGIDWTAVEIDVRVAELAVAYFGYRGQIYWPTGRTHDFDLDQFPGRTNPAVADHPEQAAHSHRLPGPYRGRAVIQDGRQFLASHTEPVSFIVLDAYNSDSIPFHLITREFFELVRDRLTDDGILAINYIGPPADDLVTDSLFRTLAAVFGAERIEAYRSDDDPDAVQCLTVLAFRRPMRLTPRWREHGHDAGEDQVSRMLRRLRVRLEGIESRGMVITDDHNPIDLARARTALAWRERTREVMQRP